jgi:hypothetical protein
MIAFTLSDCAFIEPRLNKRFITIIGQLSTNIAGSIPTNGVIWSQIKAIYRFLSNVRVFFECFVRSEQARLIHSMAQSCCGLYYHIQDTTTLNYTGQKGATDLDCLTAFDQRGFLLHSSLILDDQACVEGLLHQTIWGRCEEELGRSKLKKTRYDESMPIETKENYRWLEHFELFQSVMMGLPDRKGISISDAESDFYELFLAKTAPNVDLIVRAHHNRSLLEPEAKLFEAVSAQACCGRAFIECLKSDKHNKRSVELEIRFTKVYFPIPAVLKWGQSTPQYAQKRIKNISEQGHLSLYVVQAKEINAPLDVKPIEWTILTTLEVNDYWDALSAIQKYALRWQIEIFHLALKEGCAIEKLQLQKQHRLKNAIALFSIIAMAVLRMKHVIDKYPHEPMTITGFSKQDYDILMKYIRINHAFKAPIVENPTVTHFADLIITLSGGKIKYKGIRQLWKALAKVDTILKTAFALAKE